MLVLYMWHYILAFRYAFTCTMSPFTLGSKFCNSVWFPFSQTMSVIGRKQNLLSPHLHWNYSECRLFNFLKYSWTSTCLFIGAKQIITEWKQCKGLKLEKFLFMEGKSRLSQKLLVDQPVVHSDSYAEGWTAANSLPKTINSEVSYLLQSRFDWLGKFCQWKHCIYTNIELSHWFGNVADCLNFWGLKTTSEHVRGF